MTEQRRRKPAAKPSPQPEATSQRNATANDVDETERILGRAVAVGLPILSIVGAIAVGFAASVGSALLVLASGALLGTIALLWASVRTLSGDAPLPADLEALFAQSGDIDELSEQKRRLLRALKDLESEHAIGKLDDADYEGIAAQYRNEAKALMREMDENAAPALAEAERVARTYLEAQGLGPNAMTRDVGAVGGGDEPSPSRQACRDCGTSNEPDAAFCKKCGARIKGGDATLVGKHDATS